MAESINGTGITAEELPPFLERDFFARDTEDVARHLLGTTIVRYTAGGPLVATVVEVEAYLGEHDPAAHAAAGRTNRTQVLYGEPGHGYVFQLRAYHCFNYVAEPVGYPGCVLLRAVQPEFGIEQMRASRRPRPPVRDVDITNGPGKLCQAMGINMAHYGVDLLDEESPLQARGPLRPEMHEVAVSKRIGITKAADWDMRFTIKGNPYVSGGK